MISGIFRVLGWFLFVTGLIVYGLYMSGTAVPPVYMPGAAWETAEYYPLTIAHKHQAYSMILFGSAFLFAHRIIDLLEQLVDE
mgnify:CR=1 FL=1